MQKVCRRYVFIYTYSFLIITTLRVVVTVFFSSFTRLRLESGHLFDLQAALLKIGQILKTNSSLVAFNSVKK